MQPAIIQATTIGFLQRAIREYRSDPNSVTKARLESAQRKAGWFEIGFYASFVILPLLAVLVMRLAKRCFSSKHS